MAKVENVKKTLTKKTDKKKITKKVVRKEGFSKGVKKELKQVKWPTGKEIFKYTIATIIFCMIFMAFFEILNFVMALVKGMFN